MSFFSWLTKKSNTAASQDGSSVLTGKNRQGAREPVRAVAPAAPQAKTPVPRPTPRALLATLAAAPANPAANIGLSGTPLSVERKEKRHARREQLYTVIRESMTRAGMLSASYKFKVLSLDQNGNQFLVMMDVASQLGTNAQKLSQTEAVLMQTAKAGYGIVVTAVYWRVDPKTIPKPASPAVDILIAAEAAPAPPGTADAFAETQASAPYLPAAPVLPVLAVLPTLPIPPISAATPSKSRSDPMLEAEVAAFKRALATASPAAPATAAARASAAIAAGLAVPPMAPALGAVAKEATAVKSYALITGFEDTEMPDSPAMPALSATQYGELS